jgi:hypothetical protein
VTGRDPGTRFEREGIALAGDRGEDDVRVLTPCVLAVRDRSFRLFYMGHGRASPRGTRGAILSARSDDGIVWVKEPGVRVPCIEGEERTLSPSVIATCDGWRMLFESSMGGVTSIVSAASRDGLTFEREGGVRVAERGASVGSPRALVLADGRLRLYFHVYPQPMRHGLACDNHIVSAISADGGLTFEREPGVRIEQTIAGREDEAVYSAQVVTLAAGGVRMYYAAWNGAKTGRGTILTAVSPDGLTFTKFPDPVLVGAAHANLESAFASEPCVFRAADGRWRMLYEAADATGTTRILAARWSRGRPT